LCNPVVTTASAIPLTFQVSITSGGIDCSISVFVSPTGCDSDGAGWSRVRKSTACEHHERHGFRQLRVFFFGAGRPPTRT
jgi:hypothetical protein